MAHIYPQLTKQMIMTAFPVMTLEKITPENAEGIVLNTRSVFRNFAQMETEEETTGDRVMQLFAQGGRATSSSRSMAW
jgi:hypothetical protein